MTADNKKLKVAQIVCAFPPYAGGIAYCAKQLDELLANNYEIDNFHPDNQKTLLRRGHGALIISLLWRLRKYDYIYLHYPFFGSAELVFFHKLFNKKTKLIIHYHMDVINQSFLNKLLAIPSRLIRTPLLKQASTIVVTSLDYAKNSQIKKYYQKNSEKFQEIPCSIDISKFRPDDIYQKNKNKLIEKSRQIVKSVYERFIRQDKLNLLFIGGLDKAHYFKGISVLFSALAKLNSPNWRLQIIGDGDLRSSYEDDAYNLGLEKQIKFLGKLPQADLIKTLQKANVLVLPSINSNEAFGIVLIEALACGVPVIASSLPGVRSVFTNEKEGLLVKPGDSEDLAHKIKWFMDNEAERQVMSQRARALATLKYNQENLLELYEDLFNQ